MYMHIRLWEFHRVPYGTIAPHMFNKQGIQTIYYTPPNLGVDVNAHYCTVCIMLM